MTVYYYSGLVGLNTNPTPDWVGKSVVFSCTYVTYKSRYEVTISPSIEITPDYQNLTVFTAEEEPQIQLIEQMLNIVKIKDPIVKQQRLIDVVNDSTKPAYIRMFCMRRVVEFGGEREKFSPHIHDQFIEWRKNLQNIDLQIFADILLVNYSFYEYEWREERLTFLRKMRDKVETPDSMKIKLKLYEDKAKEHKLYYEEYNKLKKADQGDIKSN